MTGRAGLERDVLILACAISAGIHVALAPGHGPAFTTAAVVLAAVAAALTLRPRAAAVACAAAVLAGLLAAYGLAISTGLPLVHPEREPVAALALFTKAVEVAGLLAAGSLLRRRAAGLPRAVPLPLTALIAVFSALAALAVSGGHGGHV